MIVTYMRSSSISSYKLCQFKWALNYVFGVREEANNAASVGNAVHKALELRAWAKKCQQDGVDTFIEPESKFEISVKNALDKEYALQFGYVLYFKENPNMSTDGNWIKALQMFNSVVNPGIYDPAKLDIVTPEQFFDLPIEKPWAVYKETNPFNGEEQEFSLRVRGTVDLIAKLSDDVIHYIDWKTGRQWDWASGKKKTYESLDNDEQLLLYYYALRKLYPDKQVIMTIYYIVGEGPITLNYGDEHITKAEEMIEKNFKDMLKNKMPARMMDKVGPNKQPCSFCSFKKNIIPKTGENSCDYYWEELQQLGVDKMMKKYNNEESLTTYSGGGGVSGERK